MKPLFNINGSVDNSKKPKPAKEENPQPKKQDKKQSTKNNKKTVKKTDTDGWEKLENFYRSLSYETPYEFCVNIGDKRIARGYLSSYGGMCTDDPYILTVMKKKNGFIYFRKLNCADLQSCPNNFPSCQNCNKYKK